MATKEFLEQAYLAYFGRPVDPNGAAAYENSTETEVENAFWASPESQALYGDLFGVQQINMVYNILFGRDAEQAGLAYWANQIVIGALTPAGAAIGILRGALNDDIIVVNNKLAASAAFTAGLDTTEEILGFAGDEAAAVSREWLATVTMTPATQAEVDAAIAAATGVGGDTGGGDTGGQTFEFTLGQDIFDGTSYSDVFSGFVGKNNNGVDISTVQTWDKVNGGDGVDTLNLLLQGQILRTTDPTMANVEVIAASGVNGNSNYFDANATINFANISGVNTLEIRDTNSVFTSLSGMNISDEITNYKFTNVARQEHGVSIGAGFNAGVFSGTNDAITVQLASAGNSKYDQWAYLRPRDPNGNSVIEVMNVESNGSDNRFHFDDGALIDSVLNTINVTGSAALNLFISKQQALTTVNAATFDGGLTWGVSASPSLKNMTITTGAGKDVIDLWWKSKDDTVSTGAGDDTVRMGNRLATGDLLDGGAGTDTLGMYSASAVAASALTGTDLTNFQALFRNFEALELQDNLGSGTIDMAKLNGMQTVVLSGHQDGATIIGLTSGATIEQTLDLSGNGWLNAGIAGAGMDDVLNVNLTSKGFMLEKIVASGVETLNIVTTDTDNGAHTNFFEIDSATLTSVKVSGNTGLSFGGESQSRMNVTNFDASGVTGAAADAAALGIFFSSNNNTATDSVSISGGSGNDTVYGGNAMDVITGGLGNDTLSGGGGNDTLTGGAGLDTLTGGASSDTFSYGTTATDSNGGNVDVITDFVSGTDKIDTAVLVTYTGGANDYSAVLNSLNGTAYQGVLDISTSTLYIDVNGDALLDSADMVINLTGVTTLAQADFM